MITWDYSFKQQYDIYDEVLMEMTHVLGHSALL